jgi:hypothetical protein
MPFPLESKLIERGGKFIGKDPWQCNVQSDQR